MASVETFSHAPALCKSGGYVDLSEGERTQWEQDFVRRNTESHSHSLRGKLLQLLRKPGERTLEEQLEVWEWSAQIWSQEMNARRAHRAPTAQAIVTVEGESTGTPPIESIAPVKLDGDQAQKEEPLQAHKPFISPKPPDSRQLDALHSDQRQKEQPQQQRQPLPPSKLPDVKRQKTILEMISDPYRQSLLLFLFRKGICSLHELNLHFPENASNRTRLWSAQFLGSKRRNGEMYFFINPSLPPALKQFLSLPIAQNGALKPFDSFITEILPYLDSFDPMNSSLLLR